MRIGLDLDGTLISCKEKHTTLMAALAKAHSIEFDIERYWSLKQSGKSNYLALNHLGITQETVILLDKEWRQKIENLEWSFFDRLLPDTISFLKKLKDSENSLHLISARNNSRNARQQLHHLNLTHYFDSIDFVNSQRGEKKLTFFKAREIIAYIGDTEYDKQSADLANIRSYLVSSGMRDRNFLSQYACSIFDSLTEVSKMIV